MLKLAFCIANVTCTHAPLVCIFIKLYILCLIVFGLLNCRNLPWPLLCHCHSFFARHKSVVFLLEGGNENIQFGPIKLAVPAIV